MNKLALAISLMAAILFAMVGGYDLANRGKAQAVAAATLEGRVVWQTVYTACGETVYETLAVDGWMFGAPQGRWDTHPQAAKLFTLLASSGSLVRKELALELLNGGGRCA